MRLCIDLKHLRMKKESLKVAEHALLESSWVKTGCKGALFRIKDNLNQFLINQETKTRKRKRPLADEDDELQTRKAADEIIKEVALTQNPSMLTQLNSQIGMDVNPELTDQYQILRQEADSEYFREVYIRCKRANSHE